jgi:pimeloyl-ACP methyl ester carboxylesterase
VCPPADSRELKELIPHAELLVWDDCGHQPFYEDPDRFNALLRSFVAARGAAGAAGVSAAEA